MSTFLRRLLVGAASVLGLVLVAALAAMLWMRTADQSRAGTFAVRGLAAPVDVIWTPAAVPHIRAGSIEDAVFAQGFLHARDRLWQMELVRRAVMGRLSEVMGESALGTDLFMRRLGLYRAAEQATLALPDEERRLLQAYADGVNAALDGWSGALPPEFLVLRYEPAPWEPVHTMAVAKMMSYTLAAYGEAVSVARALRRLPSDRVRWLFPDAPEWGATILPDTSGTDTLTVSTSGSMIPEPPATPALAARLIERYSIAAASNSWVIAGDRTASGKPILANDMHLQLQSPSLWYLVGLSAPPAGDRPGLEVAGVSIPGAPLVITGRNRAVAWGFTNAYVDDVDLFIERVDPEDPSRYLTPDGPRPFAVRAETIRVKGRDEPRILEVRETRHGPLLQGEAPPAAGDTVLSVRWTALDPTTAIGGILGFNLASGWEEFLAAADRMDDPHQNLVYADTAGNIGYIMGGTVPVRGDRRPAPVAPRPGWTGEWDWSPEPIPFDEHPRTFNPGQGFVVTANNRQVAGPLAEVISQTWNQPFRAMRITELIRDGSPPYDQDDVLAMQMDVYDLYAERYTGHAVEAAEAAGLPDVADRLRGWDLQAGPASTEAALFYAWNEIVRRTLARDLHDGEIGYFTRGSAGEVLERRAVPWADRPEARYREIVVEAMRQAAELHDGRPWSEANLALHSHALGDVDILDRVLGLDIGPMDHYGSPTTVNVAHWAFQTPDDDYPFTTTAGVSMRQVLDMGNTDGAGGFVIPTGQSGLPFSPHYDDQVGMWREGGLLTLPLDRRAVEALATEHMRLDPKDR